MTGGFAFLNVDGKFDLATVATGDKEALSLSNVL